MNQTLAGLLSKPANAPQPYAMQPLDIRKQKNITKSRTFVRLASILASRPLNASPFLNL